MGEQPLGGGLSRRIPARLLTMLSWPLSRSFVFLCAWLVDTELFVFDWPCHAMSRMRLEAYLAFCLSASCAARGRRCVTKTAGKKKKKKKKKKVLCVDTTDTPSGNQTPICERILRFESLG